MHFPLFFLSSFRFYFNGHFCNFFHDAWGHLGDTGKWFGALANVARKMASLRCYLLQIVCMNFLAVYLVAVVQVDIKFSVGILKNLQKLLLDLVNLLRWAVIIM